jgi:hypothetical protein
LNTAAIPIIIFILFLVYFKVARAYAQAAQMDDQIAADSDTLDWYKERITYLEDIRTELTRQLEHGNAFIYLLHFLH